MLKKFLKFILISAIMCCVLVVLVLKNPNIIGFFLEKFTHNKLTISTIDYSVQNKSVIFNTNSFSFHNQKLDLIANDVKYVFNFDGFNSSIFINKLDINYQGLKLRTTLDIRQSSDTYIITGSTKKLIVADVLPHLGIINHPKSINYLQKTLKTGEVKDLNYQIIKNNKDYDLNIDGKIINGYIKFADGWDYIDDIYADFTIDKEKMLINFSSANIKDIIADGIVEVNWSDKLFIGVNAKTNTKTEIVLNYLKHQPFDKKLLDTFNSLDATGSTSAKLDLHLPIGSDDKKSKVVVDANLSDNNLYLFDKKVNIKNINAKLNFNKVLSIVGNASVFDYQNKINLQYDKNLIIDANSDFGNVVISKNENIWGVNIVGKNIFSDFAIDNSYKTPMIDVSNLVLNTKKFSKESDKIKIVPEDIKDFKLSVKNININNTKIPDFKTEFVKKKDGVHIKDLHFNDIKLGEENIKFNGLWINDLISFRTNLAGDKLDDLFTSFDIGEKTIGGKFNIDLRGFCECSPWQLTLDKLSGYGKVHIEKGVFSEQDANIGRILSILNISTLTKRLKLDVDDITNKGFSYDNIDAELILQKGGIASIENFNLDSSSSKINISGNSDIINQTYNLKAEIIPAVKDSIPVATALAGGGAAGLGVWLIDKYIFQEKILNSVLGDVVNYKYKISGDWRKPKIEKL